MTGAAGKNTAFVVAGPTCSGKSALALDLAARVDGVIINADSMQVYRELRVLTARPDAVDEARAPHALYGVRPAGEPGTAAWWRTAALAAMQAAHAQGRVPILCGGTGMYLAALWQGLADIPDPGEAARAEARGLLAAEGAAALHARLARVDPVTAAGLRPSDGQRLARAWEVWRGTGQGLAAWHARSASHPGTAGDTDTDADIGTDIGTDAGTQPVAPGTAPGATGWSVRAVVLDPPRAALRAAIAGRFAAMLRGGALEEVRGLLDLGLDPALPAMRAHGVPELSAYLRGEIGLPEAERRAVVATGQYTRRQATWFRHRPVVPADSNAAQENTHRLIARYACLTQLPDSFTSLS